MGISDLLVFLEEWEGGRYHRLHTVNGEKRKKKGERFMERTHVLEHGHIVLPEVTRHMHQWDVGQELFIVERDDGVLLTSHPLFPPTTLDEVAGCLKYTGPAKTLDEMHEAIAEGVKQRYAHRD
jgi:bifunctional DNA-binding transcriptional regulator/antitoxin component of YhaV-PrlF toxin-antitoxin module